MPLGILLVEIVQIVQTTRGLLSSPYTTMEATPTANSEIRKTVCQRRRAKVKAGDDEADIHF